MAQRLYDSSTLVASPGSSLIQAFGRLNGVALSGVQVLLSRLWLKPYLLWLHPAWQHLYLG